MATQKTKLKTVDEYIDAAPKGAQEKLRELRACIRKVAPEATEGLKWGLPAFSSNRILVAYSGHKNHVSLHPTPSAVKAHSEDLSGFVTSDNTIQFPLDKPLPISLIRKIAAFRVRESVEQDKKWRS